MISKTVIIKLTLVVFIIPFLFAACTIGQYKGKTGLTPENKPFEASEFCMGTVITQQIYGENADSAAAAVNMKMRDIEKRMTVNAEGGEINRLNDMAGSGEVVLSSDTFYVLETAIKFSELSKGAFDVTVGPLVKAWGISAQTPRVPPAGEIDRLLKLVDYRDIQLNKADMTAALKDAGQMVDLGGIAKGFAGDEAVRIYKEHGINSAYVNLGGNVVVLGAKPDGNPWRIGIQDPRGEKGEYIGIVEAADCAVVTSGDYERYYEANGKRYHHILDPKTGYPADTGLISVTIVAGKSIDADVLSTAAFVLGPDKGFEMVNALEGVEAVFVTHDKKVYTTEGLKDRFVFNRTNKEYEYVEKR